MWFNYIAQIFPALKKYRICLGLDPRRVVGPAIIIAPLSRQLLCCGLAGVVTVKGAPVQPDSDCLAGIQDLLPKISERGLMACMAGSLPLEQYLGGDSFLEEMEQCVRSLKGDDNFCRLFSDPGLITRLTGIVEAIKVLLSREEKLVEENAGFFSTVKMETINSHLVLLRDIVWMAERDVLGNMGKILQLAGAAQQQEISAAALRKYKKINFLFNCLDRLEVRGRDSAGLQTAWELNPSGREQLQVILAKQELQNEFTRRSQWGDLVNGSLNAAWSDSLDRAAGRDSLSFTYKTSSIVGELGRNAANLRKSLQEDKIFNALAGVEVFLDTAIVHTRWASVGSISQENCHPVNNFTCREDHSDDSAVAGERFPHYGAGAWTISVALNGDIDNYPQLRQDMEKQGAAIATGVTTDTKIIPLIIQDYLRRGDDLATAFRRAVNDFEGSHAIAMVSNVEPGKVFLALKGSGQALYVGIAPDQYVFSSELYGLVEMTPFFLKMDGEKSSGDTNGSAGQIFILDQESEGGLAGIRACFYDGTPLALQADTIMRAEITTRDIDRGAYPHYFLKEITEAGFSVGNTLRGKYLVTRQGTAAPTVTFNLGEDVVSAALKEALLSRRIKRIIVTGHGTAAVAGEAIACAMERYLEGSLIKVDAKIASELSGFCLADHLNDILIIAITQSGTTTDTNRAVAMAVERGATVVAIVNRRQSDITTKAQGVFYTSNGRDIEMSVASTKAFYSQIVAGHILALYLTQLLGTRDDTFIVEELGILEQAPALMARVLEKKEQIRQAVQKVVGQKKYWAVVGSGPNKAAADEIRIKLSELCYRTISSDVVENKKHIDLSAEPLIIVCAAGTPEAVLGDIIKDVAIFKAHKAGVVVFTEEGERRFDMIADAVIELPHAPLPLPVILNTVAGHLWGYYAALVIDEEAVFFRTFRARLNAVLTEQTRDNYSLYEKMADRRLNETVRKFYRDFHQRRQQGAFSFSHVKTISDLVLLLKYAAGKLPLDDFWREFPGSEGFTWPGELLDVTLGQVIDELSRPVDAIRHQAKTVTVGTSRKEPPLRGIIFELLKELEYSARSLATKNIIALTALQPAIGAIKGYTLYEVGNLDVAGKPTDSSTISIRNKAGIALGMRSRAETEAVLMGTKRTIVSTNHLYVGYGKADGAAIVILPLQEGPVLRQAQDERASGRVSLLLIHVAFDETLTLQGKKDVLGYRYNDIRNLINEYNLPWDDGYLSLLPMAALLGEPVEVLAERIRQEATKGQ